MRKLMMIAAVTTVAFAGAVKAENDVVKKSFATEANTLVTTNYITLGAKYYRDINKIVVKNNGANTATINLDICDRTVEDTDYSDAVFTDLATYVIATTASTNSFPVRAGSYGSTTNVALYQAMELRAIITLSATNATQANIDFNVYGSR